MKAEQPQADKVRVERGDGGIDVYIGELTDPGGIEVFQCKFFPQGLEESQKGQIRESFRRCLSNPKFKLKKWTLCLPVDLSVDEKRWFEGWRAVQASSAVAIDDPWGATKLEGLLYEEKNKGLKEAFFKEEHLTTIREVHNLLQQLVADMAQRLTQDALDRQRRQSGGKGGDAEAETGGAAMGGGGEAAAFGDGGEGGKTKAVGTNSVAIGGLGGGGGIYPGGSGGDVIAYDGVFKMGGSGGEAPQPDGRGGRGGRSPADLLGFPNSYRLPDGRWPGEGGRGANTPAYDGKVATIGKLCREYCELTLLQPVLPEGNTRVLIPLDWLNQRLEQMGTTWRFRLVDGAYTFHELSYGHIRYHLSS